MLSAFEILSAAITLLSEPGRWTACAWARNASNEAISGGDVFSPEACKWCLAGALHKVTGPDYATAPGYKEAVHHLSGALGDISEWGTGIMSFNDKQSGPGPVVDLLLRARARAEAVEQERQRVNLGVPLLASYIHPHFVEWGDK